MKEESYNILTKQAEDMLIKDLTKLLNRIEKIFIPSYSLEHNPIAPKFAIMHKKIHSRFCIKPVEEFSHANIVNVMSKNSEFVVRKIDWQLFEQELLATLSFGEDPSSFVLPEEVIEEIYLEKKLHSDKLEKAIKREKIRQLQASIISIH